MLLIIFVTVFENVPFGQISLYFCILSVSILIGFSLPENYQFASSFVCSAMRMVSCIASFW